MIVQGQNAPLQKINSPAHSKLLSINYESEFDKPGPSWKVDVSESSMSRGQKFDGNTSFLSESQVFAFYYITFDNIWGFVAH